MKSYLIFYYTVSKFDRAKALQGQCNSNPASPIPKERIFCIIHIDGDNKIYPEKNGNESKDRLGLFISGKQTFLIKHLFQQNHLDHPTVSPAKILYADGNYLRGVEIESSFFPSDFSVVPAWYYTKLTPSNVTTNGNFYDFVDFIINKIRSSKATKNGKEIEFEVQVQYLEITDEQISTHYFPVSSFVAKEKSVIKIETI